jgi:hypothetical protein
MAKGPTGPICELAKAAMQPQHPTHFASYLPSNMSQLRAPSHTFNYTRRILYPLSSHIQHL